MAALFSKSFYDRYSYHTKQLSGLLNLGDYNSLQHHLWEMTPVPLLDKVGAHCGEMDRVSPVCAELISQASVHCQWSHTGGEGTFLQLG